MTALCRFEMLLPLRFNDGQVVPTELIAETIHAYPLGSQRELFSPAVWGGGHGFGNQPDKHETIHELEDRFGAATWETQVLQGRWRHEGTTYRDELLRVFVDTQDTKSNRDFFTAYKARLKSRFKQLDIWLTVHPIEVL